MVLRRNYPTAHHHHVARAGLAQRLDQLRHEGLVPGRLAGDADHMDVVLQRIARRLIGRLEERADIHVEADVGEGRRDHLGAAVVPVLAELDHENARPAALGLGEEGGLAPDGLEGVVLRVGRAVDAETVRTVAR